MIAIDRIVPAFVFTILVGAASGAGAADPQSPLPDVTVTAPAPLQQPTPSPYGGNPYNPRMVAPTDINPYDSRNRVDEEIFAEKPCDQTRFLSNLGGKCLEGYHMGMANPGSLCHVQMDVIQLSTAAYHFEADVHVTDPYKTTSSGTGGCAVHKTSSYDLNALQDMNLMTRRGVNWRNYIKSDDNGEVTAEYSDGKLNCIATRRLGPIWRGGVIWAIHASLCRTDGAAVQPSDLHTALASLRIQVYDPIGNIRPPEHSIMYATVE
jgi:hypothetical protein